MDEDLTALTAKWLQFRLDNAELISRIIEYKSRGIMTVGLILCLIGGIALLFSHLKKKTEEWLVVPSLILFVGVLIVIIGYNYSVNMIIGGSGQ